VQTMQSMPHRRNVLVTGAAVRLGAALTRTFAIAGWRVFCHYGQSREAANNLTAELCAAGYEVVALQADLSSEVGCQNLIAKVKAYTGKLDCLINNASSFEPDSATSFDSIDASSQLQMNLLSPLSLARWMAQELVPDHSPTPSCVIHILDQKVFNLNPDYFTYTLGKLALERAVSLQAQALAPKIRVCGVAPGLMYLSGPQTRENFELASRANLLGRATDPDDVAKTCLFLASTTAITGVTLTVDNGQHLVPLSRDIMFVVEDFLAEKRREI
jgi:NAD(P)-dependent dehydrogenase (short-subunit alcohol dehydrogenase family)